MFDPGGILSDEPFLDVVVCLFDRVVRSDSLGLTHSVQMFVSQDLDEHRIPTPEIHTRSRNLNDLHDIASQPLMSFVALECSSGQLLSPVERLFELHWAFELMIRQPLAAGETCSAARVFGLWSNRRRTAGRRFGRLMKLGNPTASQPVSQVQSQHKHAGNEKQCANGRDQQSSEHDASESAVEFTSCSGKYNQW